VANVPPAGYLETRPEETTMSDEKGFLRAIQKRPDDSSLRAVYHRLVNGRWREGIHPITKQRLAPRFGPTSVLQFFDPGVRVQVACRGNPERKSTAARRDTIDALVAAVR
jgi:hypothetical protein